MFGKYVCIVFGNEWNYPTILQRFRNKLVQKQTQAAHEGSIRESFVSCRETNKGVSNTLQMLSDKI